MFELILQKSIKTINIRDQFIFIQLMNDYKLNFQLNIIIRDNVPQSFEKCWQLFNLRNYLMLKNHVIKCNHTHYNNQTKFKSAKDGIYCKIQTIAHCLKSGNIKESNHCFKMMNLFIKSQKLTVFLYKLF